MRRLRLEQGEGVQVILLICLKVFGRILQSLNIFVQVHFVSDLLKALEYLI